MPRVYNGYAHTERDFYTSLRFGTTASVALASLTTYASSAFSISAWVYLRDFSAAQTLMSGAAGCPEVTITTGGLITFGPQGSAVICTSVGPLAPMEWHHITVTYNPTGTVSRIYVNGEDAGASTTAGTFTSAAAATMSMVNGSFVDDLKLYAKALSQSEVRAEFYGLTGTATPAHNFAMRDAIGAALADSSGAATGTATNCTFSSDNLPFVLGYTPPDDSGFLIMDGTGYVSTTANLFHAAFNGYRSIMVSAWVSLANGAVYCYPVGVSAGGTTHLRMEIDKNQTHATVKSQSGDAGQIGSVLVANSQYHKSLEGTSRWVLRSVVIDFQAKTMSHYANGVLIGRATGAAFGSNTMNYGAANILAIGAAAGGSTPVRGKQGPTYICASDTFTNQQIRDLYLTGKVPGTQTLYWLFGEGAGTTPTQFGTVTQAFNATIQGAAKYGFGSIGGV